MVLVRAMSGGSAALVYLQRVFLKNTNWPSLFLELLSPPLGLHPLTHSNAQGTVVICETSSKIPKWKTLFSCILPTVTENWEFTGIEDLLWVRWLIAFPTKTSALQRHNCYNPFPLGSGEWPSCSLALSLKTQRLEMRNKSRSLHHLPNSTTFFDGIKNTIKYKN